MQLSAAAQAMHDDATARGKWLIWTLTDTDLEHPGRYVGRAHEADHTGGKLLPGALVARTLAELRAMLPTGLEQGSIRICGVFTSPTLDRTLRLPFELISGARRRRWKRSAQAAAA